jgi:hypothetical protein
MIDPFNPETWLMSDLERAALQNAYKLWKVERMPNTKDDKAFEVFSMEQVLKDAELSDEEIEAGNFGGGNDGGVDGFYFFINRVLVQDESSLPDAALSAELVLIQSTRTPSFTEDKVQKMEAFCRDVFDWKDLSKKKL